MRRLALIVLVAGCARYRSATVREPSSRGCYEACVNQDESMSDDETVACVAKCPNAITRDAQCTGTDELCVQAKQ